MAKRQQTEISNEVLSVIRALAKDQGVSETALVKDALDAYLAQRRPGESWRSIANRALGVDVTSIAVGSHGDAGRAPVPAALHRMSSRFDLDEDQAMQLAVEEQHALREERAARRRAEG